MAIQVNVISENTTFTVENANYATVALPITACWGPCFSLSSADPDVADIEDALESTAWGLFPAGPDGLEAFISTYRGPSSNYRSTQDYSYFMALSLLNAGYAVQTCRLCPGTMASTILASAYTETFNGDGATKAFALDHSCNSVNSVKVNGTATTAYTISDDNKLTFTTAPADEATIIIDYTSGGLVVTAKYPGTFGNNLRVSLKRKISGAASYWNLIGYAVDSNGTIRAVENLVFVFDPEQSTDTVVTVNELQSRFFTFAVDGVVDEDNIETDALQPLSGGADVADATSQTATSIMNEAVTLAASRYGALSFDNFTGDGTTTAFVLTNTATQVSVLRVTVDDVEQPATAYTVTTVEGTTTITFTTAPANNKSIMITYVIMDHCPDYVATLLNIGTNIGSNKSKAESLRFNEWVYTYAAGYSGVDGIYALLKDKINYNPNRVISPWDDQNISALDPTRVITDMNISPMHKVLMDIANASRCATAYIDIPKSLPRNRVWDDTEGHLGYAQKLSSVPQTFDDPLYTSSSALFAPWGQYVYAGTTKQATATPSFMALLIERAMIKNQSAQYEWALPNTRNNNVKLGQLAYTVPKKLLDNWQASDGTRVNTITTVPSLGTTIWGNATLFDVPVATYQALMNLSTRKLINAVKDTVYKIGIGLEFQYNGQEAYAKFYAGVTPLLDTMRNVGAVLDYKVKMAADINNIDSINANSVVGTIYLVIAGVIENITVDLIALPQGTDLSQY